MAYQNDFRALFVHERAPKVALFPSCYRGLLAADVMEDSRWLQKISAGVLRYWGVTGLHSRVARLVFARSVADGEGDEPSAALRSVIVGILKLGLVVLIVKNKCGTQRRKIQRELGTDDTVGVMGRRAVLVEELRILS